MALIYLLTLFLYWKKILKFPEESLSHLSKESIDFVSQLICDRENRLCYGNGIKDMKNHPWLTLRNIFVNPSISGREPIEISKAE